MAQPRKLEHTALSGLLLQAVFLVVCWVLASKSGSRAVGAETWHVAAGLLVWFLVLVHGRQRRLAREEREEWEQLKQARLSEEIFEETELDTMRASGGLLIFEKYLVPVFSVVLSGLLLYRAFRIGHVAWTEGPVTVAMAAPTAVGMVFIGFPAFLMGKYAAGLAQDPTYRLLRAAGGYVLGNFIATVLIAIAMAMQHFNIAWGESVVTYLIPLIMALVGLEILLNLVLDIYRPRMVGQERRPPYDSRLLGLLAEPGGVLKTVATTLDYQFGFKVSETWFYRFMERYALPLFAVQVVSLWLLSSIAIVDQGEIAFVEYFGRPYLSVQDEQEGLQATVFEPGFHLKAPWPLAIVRYVPAYEVQSVAVGKVLKEDPKDVFYSSKGVSEEDDVILWKERHIDPKAGKELNFLVPSHELPEEGESADVPTENVTEETGEQVEEGGQKKVQKAPQVNLARIEAHVHYRVKRKPDGSIDERAAFEYYYGQMDVPEVVERLAYRALSRIAASQDFMKWVAEERGQTVEAFRAMLNDAVGPMGLEVVFAGIPSVHPPPETARAYEQVVVALENKEALTYEGELRAVKLIEEAKTYEAQQIHQARGEAYSHEVGTKAEQALFVHRLATHEKAPLVYKFRRYFDAVELSLANQKLFIVPVTKREVQIIDLKERLAPQLLDIGPGRDTK